MSAALPLRYPVVMVADQLGGLKTAECLESEVCYKYLGLLNVCLILLLSLMPTQQRRLEKENNNNKIKTFLPTFLNENLKDTTLHFIQILCVVCL